MGIKLALFSTLIVFVGNPLLGAQETVSASQPKKAIVCKWTTLGGMKYFLSGQKVDGKDLEQTVFSLKDAEATRLLKQSEDSNTLGWIGIGGGGALMVAGLIGLNQDNHPNTVNPVWATAGLGGTVIAVAGAFLLQQGRTSQFAAVQRYNQVIHGEVDMSFNTTKMPVMPMLAFGMKF
jgi:hypothetical protein